MRFDRYIDININEYCEIFSGVNRYNQFFLNANDSKNNKHKTFNQNKKGFKQALEFLGFPQEDVYINYLKGANEIAEWELMGIDRAESGDVYYYNGQYIQNKGE